MVNGTPPGDPLRDDPYAEGEDYAGTYHVYEPVTDRETIAFGYNDTLTDGESSGCLQPLARYVFIAVRCLNKPGEDRCYYNITATPLPHELRNGMDFVAHLKPAWPEAADGMSARHFFRLHVSEYESLRVRVERIGDGRPLKDAYYESLGNGLSGGVYLGRGGCPTNSSETLTSACPLTLNQPP